MADAASLCAGARAASGILVHTRARARAHKHKHAHAHGLLRPAALPQVRAEQPLGPRFPPQRGGQGHSTPPAVRPAGGRGPG